MYSLCLITFSSSVLYKGMLPDLLCMSNQGGVGLRIRVFDRIMCFINCHLAAHLEAVNRRNADFDHIYKTMSFSRSSNANNAPAGISLCPFLPLFSLLKALACVYLMPFNLLQLV